MIQGVTEKEYISITELVRSFNTVLELQFPRVKCIGEISEITVAKSGHIYFKLKDETSQLDAVMWRGVASTLRFKPDRGMKVLCDTKPNIYPGSGKFQLVVHSMAPSGEGELLRKFLELKAKLEKEGLFALERKRPLPFFPLAIGVVTSGTGAVIHDIMVRIKERMSCLKVYLVDVRVQGEGASKEIADGIRLLNEFGKVDVIIVGRGGGSLEDLWAFNEEEVVRAIFVSKIPVISSVGHEVDYSLSDFVADVRAPTPTAAAEMVVPRCADLLGRINELWSRLSDFERWLLPIEQRVDDIDQRLQKIISSLFRHVALQVEHAQSKVRSIEPKRVIALQQEKINNLAEKILLRTMHQFQDKRRSVEVVSAKLSSLSPLRVLERGYSLVEREGKLITDVKDLKQKDTVKLTFARGKAHSEIIEVIK